MKSGSALGDVELPVIRLDLPAATAFARRIQGSSFTISLGESSEFPPKPRDVEAASTRMIHPP